MGLALLLFVVMVGLAKIAQLGRGKHTPGGLVAPPDQPVAFGPARTWLAIACHDAEEVVAALALTESQQVGWPRGLDAAREPGLVFVTPPLAGWTLVVSDALPTVEHLQWLALRLGKTLGTEVQGFQTDGDRHGWLSVADGQVRRAYVWSGARGQAVLDLGAPTRDDQFEGAVAEADVLQVAAAWSVDPSSLGVLASTGLGWLGRWPQA